MKLALLGTDSQILDLAAAAIERSHQFVWLGDVRPEEASALAELTPQLADRATQWELLLDRAIADAVLVGRGMATSELHAERIKRLVTEGVPLLVAQPAFDSVLPYYEIDMIRRESGAVVQHYNPLIGHPTAREAADWLRHGHPAIGPIHQLACERRFAVAGREEILAHLARDAELVAELAGDIRRVTAIGPATGESSYASLQVQMVAAHASSVRWSAGYAEPRDAHLEVTLRGETGTVSLRIPERAGNGRPTWQLDSIAHGDRTTQPLALFDAAGAAIDRLANAITQPIEARSPGQSTWDAATRAMEVVDAAELSLQKGRTIEVYQQQLTERLAFRGAMAAIGCGLLLVASLAIIVIAILGGAEGIVRQKFAPAWPVALLAVLAFFLLLQAVPFLARKPNHDHD
jgi:hypothetical protein